MRHFFLSILLLAGLTLQGTPPALPAGADLPIYTDGLHAGWGDWSWNATRDLQSTAEVYSGTYAVAVDLGDWGGLSFQHADFNTGPWAAGTSRPSTCSSWPTPWARSSTRDSPSPTTGTS